MTAAMKRFPEREKVVNRIDLFARIFMLFVTAVIAYLWAMTFADVHVHNIEGGVYTHSGGWWIIVERICYGFLTIFFGVMTLDIWWNNPE